MDDPIKTSASASPRPTIGRTVLFTEVTHKDGKAVGMPELAATVQKVNPDGSCKLWVFGDVAMYLKNSVHAGGVNGDGVLGVDDVPTPGCWHWPPRV